MDRYSKEEADSAKTLLDFYVDLVQNNLPTLGFFLAENVVLDWFGKTIKQNKKVSLFIGDQVCNKITHNFTSTFPVENVAFKQTHQVSNNNDELLAISPLPATNNIESTPPKKSHPSTSEMSQGDYLLNCTLLSPPKRIKLNDSSDGSIETIENEGEICKLKYITAHGFLEFHKPSNKKLQMETKWRRPVKLHLGYTFNSFKDCTIYLIIYEGNLKCRRNLLKEFCESDEKSTES